jgi:predicted CXXCH cytochrome family protein
MGSIRRSIVLLGVALAWAAFASAEDCASCHASLLKHANVHAAAESCDTCHEAQPGAAHPQKGKKTFKLVADPPALCATCHDSIGTKGQVHQPVKDGDCLTCHDPHASDQPKLLTQPKKELCLTCHADHAEFKHLHGPVSAGECTSCHNPHQSELKHLLVKEDSALCITCHTDMQGVMTQKGVHPALEGGCTSCHNPHGSAHPKLLSDEGPKLCFQCHDEIEKKVASAKVPHPALKSDKACTSCHSPHASANDKLLLKPQKETCLGCHPGVVTKDMTHLHGPINDGRCAACHDPHGGAHGKLLVDEFPADAYVPYTDKVFALCFRCHKRDLVQYADTSYATGFRDGERNLHYLHVNREKGRSCKLCHSIHGSSQPKLIAASVPFGKWNLPLNFVKTGTGGGCLPGCHRPQYYDRERPGRKPDLVKPSEKGSAP